MTADETGRRIFDAWHDAVTRRDLDALTALYADDARFESPLASGVLHGRAAIRAFFAAGFAAPDNGLGRWYRTGVFFCDGRQLLWEYPRVTPDGDQADLVEVMDLAGGLIAHHRVYWGWAGVKALSALAGRPGNPPAPPGAEAG